MASFISEDDVEQALSQRLQNNLVMIVRLCQAGFHELNERKDGRQL